MKYDDLEIKCRTRKKHGTKSSTIQQKTHDKVKRMHQQDEDLADFISYLDERKLPEAKNKAYKILKMEGKFVLDTNGLLFRHTYIGKWSVNQLIVPKNWIVPKNE